MGLRAHFLCPQDLKRSNYFNHKTLSRSLSPIQEPYRSGRLAYVSHERKKMEMIHRALGSGASLLSGQVAVTNGASFDPSQPKAPGSFATAFGSSLCPTTIAGNWIAPGQLPTNLGGCTLMVNGTLAMMQYASPSQINFIIPLGMVAGQASVTI